MRIVLDPGNGSQAGGPSEAADNLEVAVLAAAALRLAMGDSVDVALTRRDATKLEDRGRPILAAADLAIRIEHGAKLEVIAGPSASRELRGLALRLAAGLRRELRGDCQLRREGWTLFREAPQALVVLLSDGSHKRRAAGAIASTLAAHVAAQALLAPAR